MKGEKGLRQGGDAGPVGPGANRRPLQFLPYCARWAWSVQLQPLKDQIKGHGGRRNEGKQMGWVTQLMSGKRGLRMSLPGVHTALSSDEPFPVCWELPLIAVCF